MLLLQFLPQFEDVPELPTEAASGIGVQVSKNLSVARRGYCAAKQADLHAPPPPPRAGGGGGGTGATHRTQRAKGSHTRRAKCS